MKQQHLNFYLTLVFTHDEKTGDFTACYAQFPEASAQGRTQEEAKKLLDEIFPYLMKDKKDEFVRYHDNCPGGITYSDRQMYSEA